MTDLDGLPGAELVRRGLDDLARAKISAEALEARRRRTQPDRAVS